MSETNRYYDKYKRDKNSQAFYRSKEWKDVRDLALKRDNYLCQSCLSKKILKKAELVHHIKYLRDYPELRSRLDNLVSWCNKCHNEHHKISDNNNNNNNIKVNANLYVTKTNKEIPM